MRTVAIIQARMTSSRLPGKTLKTIGGRTILEHVIRRTHQIDGIDKIVVATSCRGSDNPIHDQCRRLNTECHRGALHDVLHRYWTCAADTNATHILRVTADSPLLDSEINTQIIDLLKRGKVDYATIFGYPAGIAMEAFTIAALDRAHTEATTPYDREHVITHMTNAGNGYRRILQHAPGQQPAGTPNLSIDTHRDLDRIRELHHNHPQLFDLAWPEICQITHQKAAA